MKNIITKKQICILYVIILVLIFVTVGGFVYMEYRINELYEKVDGNMQLSMYTAKKLNNTVQLNKLDTDQCKFIINSNDWKEVLSNNTGGFGFDIPENWQLNKTEIYKCTIPEGTETNYEFTIILDINGEVTFNDFVNNLYDHIKALDYNDIVQSFNKEKGGYYEINSFDEATYNNMYYDYITSTPDGGEEGPRVKVKVLYLEETNQVKIEVNKY